MATVPTLDRRAFLTIAGSALGLTALGSVLPTSTASAASTQTVWVLSTTATCRCSACRAHAANKIFTSAAAALAGLAHVGCRCTPGAVQISSSAYAALFAGAATGAVAADRRDPAVAAALAPVPAPAGGASAPVLVVAPTIPSTTASASTPPATPPATPADPAAAASSDSADSAGSAGSTGSTQGGRPSHHGSGRGERAVDAASTDATPVPTGDARAVAASPVAHLGAHAGSSAVDWLTLPALAAVAGFGWLVWFRRRRDEDEPIEAPTS